MTCEIDPVTLPPRGFLFLPGTIPNRDTVVDLSVLLL